MRSWPEYLGPAFSLLVFLPCNALAGLFVIHFNWSTHNGEVGEDREEMHPVNLTGRWYRLGNKLFAGIYAHQLHHDRPTIFNPARALAAELASAATGSSSGTSHQQAA